jgi:AcrR family transcriptional regulator
MPMAEIARRVGLAKPTLYRLARSRDELLTACVDAETERLHERLHAAFTDPGYAGEAAEAVLLAVAGYAADSPGGFGLLFDRRVPDSRAAIRRLENRLADLLRRTGAEAEPVALELSAAALLGAASAVVVRA